MHVYGVNIIFTRSWPYTSNLPLGGKSETYYRATAGVKVYHQQKVFGWKFYRLASKTTTTKNVAGSFSDSRFCVVWQDANRRRRSSEASSSTSTASRSVSAASFRKSAPKVSGSAKIFRNLLPSPPHPVPGLTGSRSGKTGFLLFNRLIFTYLTIKTFYCRMLKVHFLNCD